MVTGLSWWLLIIYKVGGSSNFQVSDQEGRGEFHEFQHHLSVGIPKVIITDNAANLNIHLLKEICYQFKIEHRNSTPYRSKANGTVEAANKNIKKILRKMVQSSRQWHEKLPFDLLGYRTTVRTSVGATPYSLVSGLRQLYLQRLRSHLYESLWRLKLMMMSGSKLG